MVEMVGGQTVNQADKLLKKGEKKNHQFWNSRIAGLVVFSALVSSPVCECLLGSLESSSGRRAGAWWSGYLGSLQSCGRLCTRSGVPGRLVGAAVSRQDGACPSRAGLQLFHMELEPDRV
jgi:hypothetical protein